MTMWGRWSPSLRQPHHHTAVSPGGNGMHSWSSDIAYATKYCSRSWSSWNQTKIVSLRISDYFPCIDHLVEEKRLDFWHLRYSECRWNWLSNSTTGTTVFMAKVNPLAISRSESRSYLIWQRHFETWTRS